jgi:hypothetical protein
MIMASRSNSRAKSEVIEMLKEDHRRVKRAFRDAEALAEKEEFEQLQQLVQQTCAELKVHASLEEELFYPAVRESIKQPELVDEAEIEHMSAKELIAQIEAMQPEESRYAAAFKVLGEYVKHHIREEENEMFVQLERSRVDWESLLQEIQAKRPVLMEEHDISEDGEESDEQADSAAAGRAGGSTARGRRAGRVENRQREGHAKGAE